MRSSSSSNKRQIQVSIRIKPFIPVLSSLPSSCHNRHQYSNPKSNQKKEKNHNTITSYNRTTPRPKTTGSSTNNIIKNNINYGSCEDWIANKSQNFASHVWSTTHSQSMVYHDFMEEQFLPAFEQGLNCTCFLYGQTGSGTFL